MKKYKDFIASDSDQDDEKGAKKSNDIESYRKKLLDGLQGDKSELFKKPSQVLDDDGADEDGEDIDWDALNSDDLDSEDLDNLEKHGKLKSKGTKNNSLSGMKVATGFNEDIGKKMMKDKEEKKKKDKMTEFQKWEEKRRERKKKKKELAKLKKDNKHKMSKMTEE